MKPAWTRLIAIVWVVVPSVVLSQAATAQCTEQWTAPHPLHTADGRSVYVEPGVIAQSGNHILTLGGPSFIWMTPTIFVPDPKDTISFRRNALQVMINLSGAGFTFDSTGVVTRIDTPPSTGRMVWPRLFRLGRAKFGVIWQQDTTSDESHSGRLWYATLDENSWAPPRIIANDIKSWWRGTGFSGAADRRPAYGGISRRSTGKSNLALGFLQDTTWQSFDVPYPDSFNPATIESHDGFVLLEQGLDDGRQLTIRAKRYEPAVTGGLHEVAVNVLDSAQAFHGIEMLLANLGKDSLLAVWTYAVQRGDDRNSGIFSAVSADAGSTWRSIPNRDVTGIADDLRVARDGAGTIHLVYASSASSVMGDSAPIHHMSYRNGEWTGGEQISGRETHGAIIGMINGGPVVTWAEYEQQGTITAPKSFVSFWRPCPNASHR